MAFESDNLIQVSAGETSPDQISGQKILSYESKDDPLDNVPGGILEAGYFNSIAKQVRYGSYFILTGVAGVTRFYEVTSNNPDADTVVLELAFAPPTNPFYEALGAAPVDFITSGGDTDIVTFAASKVGAYASYSLNSQINDIAPPPAHSGIEYVECQLGQVLVKWSRPVIAGQTVKLWLDIREATPTP